MAMFTVLICPAAARADAPFFQYSSYSFTYSLDQSSNYVGVVDAMDPEFDDFGFVMHDPSGKFSIDAFHGYITATQGGLNPGVYSMTVEAVDEFGQSSFADVDVTVTPGPPPEIVSYSFQKMYGNNWVITGTVDSSTAEGDVHFGGLLAGRSTHYYSNGQFTLWTTINGVGHVDLHAEDDYGQSSQTVTYNIAN